MKKLSLLIVFVMLLVAVLALSTSAAFTRGPENDTITAEDVESIELISGSTGHGSPANVFDGKGAYWGGPAGSAVKITFVNEWEISTMSAYLIQNWSGCKISIHAADGTELGAFSEGSQTYNTDYIWGGDARNGKLTDMTNNIKNVSYGDNDPGVKYVVLKCTQDKWGYLTGFAEINFTGRERIPSEGCENHSFVSVEDPAPTCTEDGYIIRICELCGAQEEPSVAPALGHTYDSYTVLAPETCLSTPKIQFECTRCGEISTKDNYIQDVTDFANLSTVYIEGSGGWTNGTMFDNDMDKKQQASSGWYVLAELELDKSYYLTGVTIWTGYDSGYSGNWNMTFYYMAPDGTEWLVAGTKQVPPTIYEPHTPSKHVLVLDAPVYAKAVKIRVDSITHGNGNVYEAEISGTYVADAYAPGHQLEASEVIAPTCYQHGYTNYVCTVCGEIVKDSYVAFTGVHEYTVEIADTKVDATCTTAGSVKMQCATCTSTKDVEIPATGHSEGAATCTEAHVCTICGETVAEATGHTWYGTDCDFCDATRIATIGEASYETLADAIAASVEGDTIVVLDKVTAEGDVTWDLTGKTIQFANVVDNYALVVKGNLTIVGGTYTFVNLYGIGVQAAATLTINDGSFVTSGDYYLIGSWGETTINGGSFEAFYCIANAFDGTLTITNGTFTAKEDAYGDAEAILAAGEAVVTGGTFNTDITAYLEAGLIQDETGAVIACPHNEYTKVTCTEDSVCTVCGAIGEEAVGHVMADATCMVPEMCEICGYTEGEPAAHTIVHVEAKPGTDCQTWDGNIEYWYCSECGAAWTNEALTQFTNLRSVATTGAHSYFYPCDKACMVCYELTNEDATHTIVHVDAVPATCTTNGNIEYWYCSDCGYAWADEALTMVTNRFSIVVPAGHSYFYPCDKVCMVCFEETNPDATHAIVHVDAVPATCTENGNIEYWYCEDCGYAWEDEALTMVTNRKNVVVPAGHVQAWDWSDEETGYVGTLEWVNATCKDPGYIKDTCANCGEIIVFEEFPVDEEYGHVVVEGSYVQVDATCNADGSFSYDCAVCEQTITGTIDADPWAHAYDNGSLVDNKLVYTCTSCGATEEHNAVVITIGDNTVNFPLVEDDWFGTYYDSIYVIITTPGSYTISSADVYMDYVEARNISTWVDEFPFAFEVAEGGFAMFLVTPSNDMEQATALVTIAELGCKHANTTEIPAVLPTPSNNGTTAGVKCLDCDEVIVAPVENTVTITPSYKTFGINSTNLILGNNISLDYKVNVSEGYEILYMVFVFEGKEFVVSEYDIDGGKPLFNFAETRPHKMATNVSAYVFAKTADGYSYDVYDYSVMKYCIAKLKKSENVNVISDLLAFGAATQKYVNPSVADEDLITSLIEAQGYTLTPTAFTSIPAALKAQYVDIDADDDFTWKSSTVVLGSSTEMVYKFAASDITGLQIKIEVDGVEKMMLDASDLTIEGGRYVVSVNCVSAVQYGSEVKATFVINGVESDSVAYSINGFLYNNLSKNEGTALGDLMKALYVYGDSTYNLFYGN